ncbi:hypothetical protein H4W34_001957 [Actinomadura algeriensis]|uniref:Lipoprotein n=1 Tax=Actinomadura algeriensis TaxID=1679523 RepID=A0ABR9JNW7_9ACTN|nr:hypothetical protein [Actinomadura algeriensis]
MTARTHAPSRQSPRSHRGPSDRYALGVAHGAVIGAGMCVICMTLAIAAMLL